MSLRLRQPDAREWGPRRDPELEALIASLGRNGRRRRSKYHNRQTVVDGHRFDSRREANRYRELRLLERAGAIAQLELQPPYVLHAPCFNADGELAGVRPIGKYIADFRYRDQSTGAIIVEDAKGVRTAVYKLKRKLLIAEYGITVKEV